MLQFHRRRNALLRLRRRDSDRRGFCQWNAHRGLYLGQRANPQRRYDTASGTPTSSWYEYGAQGETRALTDSTGTITDTYAYSAYGTQIACTGTTTNPFRYGGGAGYYTDSAPGLVLCGQRWYSPAYGRWLNADPIGYDGGDNRYVYCGDNPVGGVDPSGERQLPIDLPIIRTIGGGILLDTNPGGVDLLPCLRLFPPTKNLPPITINDINRTINKIRNGGGSSGNFPYNDRIPYDPWNPFSWDFNFNNNDWTSIGNGTKQWGTGEMWIGAPITAAGGVGIAAPITLPVGGGLVIGGAIGSTIGTIEVGISSGDWRWPWQ